MSNFRPPDKFRAEWARIIAFGDYEATRRQKANQRGLDAAESNRWKVLYTVASTITERWRAAGFTSATLVDGLPRPEKPHATTWKSGSVGLRCSVCGRTQWKSPPAAMCDGPSSFDLVHRALARGVPFGLQNGLPTAGVPIELGDVVEKLARATCRPLVGAEERAAA